MRNVRPKYMVCSLVLGLIGCWEPATQETLTRTPGVPGGPWGACESTLEFGVSGDICTFSGGCGQADPTRWDWEIGMCMQEGVLLRSYLTEESPTEADVEVVDGRNTWFEFEDPAGLDWAMGANGRIERTEIDQAGCVVRTTPQKRSFFCVEDRHLPPAVESATPIELDSQDDCAVVRDEVGIDPGAACTGGGFVCDHRDETDPALFRSLYIWCHQERLRYSDTLSP